MSTEPTRTPVMDDPHAQMERALIVEYLKERGFTLDSLHGLPPAKAKQIMTEASVYASTKLTEVASRARFVEEVHGVAPPL